MHFMKFQYKIMVNDYSVSVIRIFNSLNFVIYSFEF